MWKRAVSALFQRKIPSENSLENEIVRQENSPFIHCKGGRHPGELRVPNELQASVILMLPLVRIVEKWKNKWKSFFFYSAGRIFFIRTSIVL